MYHLWSGLAARVWMSVISGLSLRMPSVGRIGELEHALHDQAQDPVDAEEEDGGQHDHDAHHHRGDPGLLPARPGDLAGLHLNFTQELGGAGALLARPDVLRR